MTSIKHLFTIAVAALLTGAAMAQSIPASFTLSTSQRGPVIGPLHYGIFYEEINHAGDGGLYAELIRNGSMEENGSNPDYWWTIGDAAFSISSQNLLNGAQKRAMHLDLTKAGDGTRNIGYWGINIQQGVTYKASFWLRAKDGWTGDITLTLESYEGADLGHATVHVADAGTWRKYTAEIQATGSYQLGWFAIRGSQPGTIYLDCVSLFPPTYKNRENGMRRDLAEKLEALHPRFMRFPGGCYIEGGQRYQWKHTIGPVEERLGIYNSNWGYPVSNGMGFHEFLLLAEDLGAEPLFVVNVGMGHGWYQDYRHIEGFIQEALDAIEYCNGDASTYWGAKRVAAGHPEPFNLRLMEIGNENYNYTSDGNNDQSDHYAERYKQFYDAIKARYPYMTLIGNSDWGSDYPTWRNQYPLEIIDEHFYRSPDWFASMYHKYDNYSRSSNKVYNGEYAVTHDYGVNGTLKAALGEAIYMAGLERNSDVCVMGSYAPIFMNENESQWRPDMLHYNAHSSFGTPSYWAQQMMASTVGHQNITWKEDGNTVGLQSAKLGLGSWGTDVSYSNVRVTNAAGQQVYAHQGTLASPASTLGTAHVLDVITDDCTIELDAVKNSGDEGFLIAFAHADDQNYVWWNLGGWANTRHGVEQAVGGQKTTLATTDGTIEQGQTYHIKIVREGMKASCYLDDQLIHTVTLSDKSGQRLFLCASLNEAENEAIVKVINYGGTMVPATFTFADATMGNEARLRVMSHADNKAENSMDTPMNVSPQTKTLPVGSSALTYDVPAYSLSVIQIPLTSVSDEAKTEPAVSLPTPSVSYSFDSGRPQSDDGRLQAVCEGSAAILAMDDGNQAAYTGADADQGYLDLGHDAASAFCRVLNGDAYSVSVNILPTVDGGQLHRYCWAWNVNNGTSAYAGLINQANNLNWYFERVDDTTCKADSRAGLNTRRWHNLTVTLHSGIVSLYVDGQLRATATATTGQLPLTETTQCWLGRSPYGADARMTDTFFDDLRFYDVALTPSQVLALSNEAEAKSIVCEALKPQPATKPNADAVALIAGGQNVDITSLLVNPDFADGTTGWEGTLFSAAPGTVAEHYYQLFDTYQVLPLMPAGYYVMQWQGFYRHGNINNAWLRHHDGTEHLAQVYAAKSLAAGCEALAAVSMLSLYDASAPFTREPYTYPDNVATAADAFAAGHYVQTLQFRLTETADLRLGLRNFTPTVYDWACVDNFRLVYVGQDLSGIHEVQPSASLRQGFYDLSGRKVKTPAKGIYISQGKKIIVR